MISPVFGRLLRRRRRSTVAIVTGLILFSLYMCATRFSAMEDMARDQFNYQIDPSSEKAGMTSHNENDYFQKPIVLPPMSYGTNARPSFKELTTFIADLPARHVPFFSDSGNAVKSTAKRLVIVGDVHGQLHTLQKLLKKVGFDNKNGDHLILTGDLITKGPDSPGVVQLAMDLEASAVRGNHEDRALLLYASDNNNTYAKDEIEAEVEHSLKVARSLSEDQRAWLSALPVILRIGRIPGSVNSPAPWNAGDILVAHGGLVPSVPIHKQDPWGVMNMRSLKYPVDENFRRTVKESMEKAAKDKADNENKIIEEENKRIEEGTHEDKEKTKQEPRKKVDAVRITDEMVEDEMERLRAEAPKETDVNEDYHLAVPNDARDGEPWSHAWNRVQNAIKHEQERSVVIYGHDAKAGLQVDLSVDIFAKPGNQPPLDINKNKDKQPPIVDDADDDGLQDEEITNFAKTREKKTKKIGKGIRYAFGLDSGAGKGKKLTALVIETSSAPGGGIVVHHSVETVKVVS
ncbi:Metallo-dependent phosphatase-like protein [Apodospora peruviana]|uniref:Metallo-dependent phosphatase-like protein n=1 Tax=Apodospora peruviana TaxID=516989 RepID=A0AAE0IUQ6_9PEZI|nr:Metallo-dependent phosphatase-like protein [Apodospora peruviana]